MKTTSRLAACAAVLCLSGCGGNDSPADAKPVAPTPPAHAAANVAFA